MGRIISRRAGVAALAFVATYGWAFFWRGYPWHLASVLAMAAGTLVYSALGAISQLRRAALPSHEISKDHDIENGDEA